MPGPQMGANPETKPEPSSEEKKETFGRTLEHVKYDIEKAKSMLEEDRDEAVKTLNHAMEIFREIKDIPSGEENRETLYQKFFEFAKVEDPKIKEEIIATYIKD